MTTSRPVLAAFVTASALLTFAMSQTPRREGVVTTIFRDVQILPADADARAAALNDKVGEDSAIRTGFDSRSELTFTDLTITRLGANTIFRTAQAGRQVRLDSGTILLYVKKNSGPAQISTSAVSVGISGTTVIFESRAQAYDQLTVLEGVARFSLNNFPDQSTEVQAGDFLHVKSGATKIPAPRKANLRWIMNNHPLIKNFRPLPSLDLILAIIENRNPNVLPPRMTGGRGPSPIPVPNPTGAPPPPRPIPTLTPRYHPPSTTPIPTPNVAPTPTARPTPGATPKFTPRPTLSRPRPRPTKKPKPPVKRPSATPTPQVIR